MQKQCCVSPGSALQLRLVYRRLRDSIMPCRDESTPSRDRAATRGSPGRMIIPRRTYSRAIKLSDNYTSRDLLKHFLPLVVAPCLKVISRGSERYLIRRRRITIVIVAAPRAARSFVTYNIVSSVISKLLISHNSSDHYDRPCGRHGGYKVARRWVPSEM